MVPFFVQIKCQLGKSYAVADALADDIGHFVNEKVQTIAGIQDTRTIITFKAF
jgi:hypothetical protein